MLEHTLRQAMVLHDNDVTVYATSPMAPPFTLLTVFPIRRRDEETAQSLRPGSPENA